MKNGYISILLIAFSAISVHSQQKMDTHTVLMSKLLSHEVSHPESVSDSSRMSVRKSRPSMSLMT